MSSILFKVVPLRTEGPHGYLLRLAQQNNLLVSDLDLLGIVFSIESLARSALLPDQQIDPTLWDWISFLDTHRKTLGRAWNVRFSRFCPLCLQDDPHWRAEWELYFYDVCHRHHAWMVDSCSSCGATLSWKRSDLLRCPCGADLRAEESRSAPDEVGNLAAALSSKLVRTSSNPLPGPLEGLDLDQTQRLIRFLGVHLNPAGPQKTVKLRNAGSLKESWSVTSFAGAVLARWPDAFHECFSTMQNSTPGRRAGLSTVLQRAYYYIYRGLRDPAFDPVRYCFEVWVMDHWRGALALRNRRLTKHLLDNVQWISAKVAAARLGIQQRQIRQLVEDGTLQGDESTSATGRRFLMVRKEQVESLTSSDITEINLSAAITLLGISKIRMRELVRLLFPSAYRPLSAHGFPPWRIYRKDVDRLLEIGHLLPSVSIPEESQVSLAHVFKYWTWSDHEIIDLIEAVRDGVIELQAMVDGAVGIGRWVFDRQSLKLWRQGRSPESSNWISVPKVAQMLGVKQEVAYWLVRNEFIKAERLRPQTGIGAQVSRAELARFNNSYVFATEIAEAIGTSSRKVVRVFEDIGITPASGRGIEKCGKVFFSKTPELVEFLKTMNVSLPSREI